MVVVPAAGSGVRAAATLPDPAGMPCWRCLLALTMLPAAAGGSRGRRGSRGKAREPQAREPGQAREPQARKPKAREVDLPFTDVTSLGPLGVRVRTRVLRCYVTYVEKDSPSGLELGL